MKLVSYVLHTEGINHRVEMYAHRQAKAQGGVLVGIAYMTLAKFVLGLMLARIWS